MTGETLCTGLLRRTARLSARVAVQSVPHRHLLPGQNRGRAAAVRHHTDHLHHHHLSDDRAAAGLWGVRHRNGAGDAGRQCVHLVWLLHLVRQLVDFDGAVDWAAHHYSVSAVRRVLPERGLGAGVLRVAVVSVVVPVRQRGPADQPVGDAGGGPDCVHAAECDVSGVRARDPGDAEL